MRTPVAQCTVFRRTPETSWWQSFKGSNNFLEMYFCVLPFSSIQALRHPLCLHFNPTALEIRILRPENIDWGKFLSLPRPVWWLWPWLWPWEKKQESMATQDPPTPAFPKIPPASLALQNSWHIQLQTGPILEYSKDENVHFLTKTFNEIIIGSIKGPPLMHLNFEPIS